MFKENAINSDFPLFQNDIKKEQAEPETTTGTLQKIVGEMDKLAEKQAEKIGWTKDIHIKMFNKRCLYCPIGCHLRGQPDVQPNFLEELWKILPAYGIDPLAIQEALKQTLLEKPLARRVVYRKEDILKLIADQLDIPTTKFEQK